MPKELQLNAQIFPDFPDLYDFYTPRRLY